MNRPSWRVLIPALLIALMLPAFALTQDSSDEDVADDSSVAEPASMSLQFDRLGNVDVSFDLPQSSISSDELRGALTGALHCPANSLNHPEGFGEKFPNTQTLTAAQRQRLQKQMERYSQRTLSGSCNAVLAKNDGLLQGDFDYSELAAELKRGGVEHLTVFVNLPRTTYHDYTQGHLLGAPSGSKTSLMYDFPLADGSAPAVLHLAYGLRRADVNRAFGILAAFILLPILLTLWMRRGAMASAREDATAAWFGFFRRLNFLITGAMLLWITSGFGARQVLQEWVATRQLASWSAAAGDALVTVAPAFFIYFVCIALSYPVYAELRGGRLSRKEFLLQQSLTLGAQAIPLTLMLAGFEMMHQHVESAVVLFILTVVVLQILTTLKLRVMKTFPQPLTTGELRDRIFALAGRLGVKVSQVFVLPAGKGQVANAYAANRSLVMFTDYLLEHLTKREVDAVAAHELAHLQHKHPGKRALAFYAAVLLPSYFTWLKTMLLSFVLIPFGFLAAAGMRANLTGHLWRATNRFDQWSQRDFVLIMLGLTAFYFLSRRFENVADATAARLTGDPEAQITGLLKLSRLNFTPIQWGKASESWLSHPSTVRRAERIAAAGGMAPERLQQILQEHSAQAGARILVPAEERYPIPANDAEKMRKAMRERNSRQGKMWAQLAVYVFPPALFSLAITHLHLEGNSALAAYAGGVVLTAGLVTLAAVWLGESGHGREKKRLAERFRREQVPVGQEGDIVVGYAPGPYPRVYGSRYHWDSGFLVLAKDRLQFVGEQTRFSLLASEIDGIVTGPGGPSWWKFARVYIHWRSADGQRAGTFNLNSLEPGSVWQSRSRVRDLCRRLQQWHRGMGFAAGPQDVRPGLADLRDPELREVTSISPRTIGRWRVNFKVLTYLFPLAIGVGLLMHAQIWYMCSSVFLLRIFQTIPYWRYKDRLPVFPPEAEARPLAKARGANAAAGEISPA